MDSQPHGIAAGDFAILHKVWLTRDRRFDGKVFVGVKSTGIYCRPICPAKTPLPKNMSFYPSAAAAEWAGFRPCKRCRPESSPGTPAWAGTSATVARAVRILNGNLNDISLKSMAERLGIGDRQLRRLFVQHLGAPPQTVINTCKLNVASQLLRETNLTVTDIGAAAGFSSIRRFNAAFKTRYGRAPSGLRKENQLGKPGDSGRYTLRLPYRTPFHWQMLCDFFRLRAVAGVEAVTGNRYARTFSQGLHVGWFEVADVPEKGWLTLSISAHSAGALIDWAARVRRLFDLDADPKIIGEHLSADPLLRPLVHRYPGLRIPGAWDGFETAVRAVLGQQVSVAGATTLAGRLVRAYGKAVSFADQPQLTHLFPTAAALMNADLSSLGIVRKRAQTIRVLAQACASGALAFDPTGDAAETREKLLAIPGIGEWSAQYIAMRALGDPNAFLKTDLIVQRALAKWPASRPEPEKHWEPWRAYATLYLWKWASHQKKSTT